MINQRASIVTADMPIARANGVDASRYYYDKSIEEKIAASSSDMATEIWNELSLGSFRPNYDSCRDRYAGGRIDRTEELIKVRLEEALKQIHKLEERIYRESTSASVMASQLNALQTTVAKQAEAMQILAAEIDELKSGQLEPLEDME